MCPDIFKKDMLYNQNNKNNIIIIIIMITQII